MNKTRWTRPTKGAAVWELMERVFSALGGQTTGKITADSIDHPAWRRLCALPIAAKTSLELALDGALSAVDLERIGAWDLLAPASVECSRELVDFFDPTGKLRAVGLVRVYA